MHFHRILESPGNASRDQSPAKNRLKPYLQPINEYRRLYSAKRINGNAVSRQGFQSKGTLATVVRYDCSSESRS